MNTLPRVLIAAPTAEAKNYCLEEWLRMIGGLRYPNASLYLCDNSNGLRNTKHLKSAIENILGRDDEKYVVQHRDFGRHVPVIERMAVSHDACRQYAIEKGFDYLFHLETDVFPPQDVIERLICHQKKVVGGLYDIDEGRFRHAMVQKRTYQAPRNAVSMNIEQPDEVGIVTGEIQKVSHVGLGCVLIDKSVLRKIHFRFKKGEEIHPDSYFAEDCARAGIEIFADTSVYCDHQNRAWK